MESLANQFFIQIYYNIDILLVIVARFVGFFVILPVLSGTSIPMVSRLGLALSLGYLVFFTGKVTEIFYVNTVAGYVILIATEFVVGFALAYVVYLVFSIAYLVGQLIDYQIGFSMVSVFDPITQIQVPIVGNLLYLLVGLFFVETGGVQAMLAAIFLSYDILPVGTAGIIGNSATILYILYLITQYFVLAVRIALPVMGTIVIVDIALGLLVKAVPQMNVFVVGMPIKLLLGLIVLLLITPMFVDVYEWLFSEAYGGMSNILRGLVPQ